MCPPADILTNQRFNGHTKRTTPPLDTEPGSFFKLLEAGPAAAGGGAFVNTSWHWQGVIAKIQQFN
jgi:hypothetical protein